MDVLVGLVETLVKKASIFNAEEFIEKFNLDIKIVSD
jgi:hypothetical protein